MFSGSYGERGINFDTDQSLANGAPANDSAPTPEAKEKVISMTGKEFFRHFINLFETEFGTKLEQDSYSSSIYFGQKLESLNGSAEIELRISEQIGHEFVVQISFGKKAVEGVQASPTVKVQSVYNNTSPKNTEMNFFRQQGLGTEEKWAKAVESVFAEEHTIPTEAMDNIQKTVQVIKTMLTEFNINTSEIESSFEPNEQDVLDGGKTRNEIVAENLEK